MSEIPRNVHTMPAYKLTVSDETYEMIQEALTHRLYPDVESALSAAVYYGTHSTPPHDRDLSESAKKYTPRHIDMEIHMAKQQLHSLSELKRRVEEETEKIKEDKWTDERVKKGEKWFPLDAQTT